MRNGDWPLAGDARVNHTSTAEFKREWRTGIGGGGAKSASNTFAVREKTEA